MLILRYDHRIEKRQRRSEQIHAHSLCRKKKACGTQVRIEPTTRQLLAVCSADWASHCLSQHRLPPVQVAYASDERYSMPIVFRCKIGTRTFEAALWATTAV